MRQTTKVAPALLGPQASRGAASKAVKDLVRKHFDLDHEVPVFVAEVTCGEALCPDVETVVAVFLASGRQDFRIAKAIEAITGADIASAKPTLTLTQGGG